MNPGATRARQMAAVVALAVALGTMTAVKPLFGALFVLVAVFTGLFFTVERAVFPIVILGALLVVPLDFIEPFAAELRGLPTLGVALTGAALALLSPRRPLGAVVRTGWDVVLFTVSLVIVFSINGISGGVRQAAMLAAGVLFYFWVRASRTPGFDTRTSLLRMLLYVGVFQGLAAILERALGASTFSSLIPLYDPALKDFTLTLGNRAVALAGHSLRLGALEMSALIAGIGLMRGTQGRDRVIATLSIGLCAIGLLLSGARGAWLGTLVGVLALLVITPAAESHKIAFRVGVASVVGWFVLDSLGIVNIIQERLFGAASRPASIAQRVGVLASTFAIWQQRPLVGYGFGTFLEEIYSQGFQFSNTENEYVNFVLSGGILSLVSAGVMGIRGVVLSWRWRAMHLVPTLGGILVAWLVNIGTFNAFSWSAGFPLFMTVLAVLADGGDE